MKNQLLFSFLLTAFVFTSCKNDDENLTQEPEPHPIEGKWELLKKEGDWNPTTYTTDEVIWTFNQNNVEIEINIEEEEHIIRSMLFPFHVSGTYEYSINENQIHFELGYMPDGGYLTHPVHISSDTLIIGEDYYSPTGGGGLKLTFKRK